MEKEEEEETKRGEEDMLFHWMTLQQSADILGAHSQGTAERWETSRWGSLGHRAAPGTCVQTTATPSQ